MAVHQRFLHTRIKFTFAEKFKKLFFGYNYLLLWLKASILTKHYMYFGTHKVTYIHVLCY